MLSLYISDRIRYTGHSTHKLEKWRDYQRHYFGHKTAKDILFLVTGQSRLSLDFIKTQLFDKKAIINYTNDLILNIFESYLNMRDGTVLNSMDYTEISTDHAIMIREKMLENFDMAYFYLSEIL